MSTLPCKADRKAKVYAALRDSANGGAVGPEAGQGGQVLPRDDADVVLVRQIGFVRCDEETRQSLCLGAHAGIYLLPNSMLM